MDAERNRALSQGLITGAIGYATVAICFGVLNLIAGRHLLHTAAVLGHRLLGTLDDGNAVTIEAAPIFVYNGLHLVLFLLVGLVASWIVFKLEKYPQLWYLVLFLVLFIFFHTIGVLLAFVEPVTSAVPMWTTLLVSLAAVLMMGGYLWLVHPRLRKEVERLGDFEDPLPPTTESTTES